MQAFDEGLRCQDVHAGLRNVDPNSGALTPLADTQLVGMAASLAALIRGRDVIDDAQALRAVAAEQLDVSQFAFDQVIALLAEVEFVEGVQHSGGRITRFTESVPFFDDLYARLGTVWESRQPTELEQQMLLVVDQLAVAPIAAEELSTKTGLDAEALSLILPVAESAELVKRMELTDGEILYSPFFGFENPALIADLVTRHGSEELAIALAQVRGEQGLPVLADSQPVLNDAIARGFVLAPAVERPNGELQPFAALPYTLDQDLLKNRKPVLEKALAVLACLRCGEHFGGATNLSRDAMIAAIDKLLDANRGFLMPHGSHTRQYALIHRAGIIRFDPDLRPGGRWVTPRFIDSEDNRVALRLARDLITHGEQVGGRVGDDQARQALQVGQSFSAPMQTLARTRGRAKTSTKSWQKVIDAAMGRARL